MAVPVVLWPAGVPTCIVPMSASGGLRDNRYSFETESKMPPIERPMTSWTPEVYQVELVAQSLDQFRLFQAWYKNDLRYGVYPFVWSHPITGDVGAWKIVKNDPPYQVSKLGNIPLGSDRRRIRVTFSVMSWPATVLPLYMAQEDTDLILQETGGSDRILVRDGVIFSG